MPLRQSSLLFAFFLIAWAAATSALSAEPIATSEQTELDPFGKIQTYDAKDNALLKPAKDGKTEEAKALQSVRALGPDAVKAYHEATFVKDYGDPQRLIFAGVSLFPEAQLRTALACDLKFQAAARPSAKIEDLLVVLQKQLLEGYLHSGCPDAKVRTEFDARQHAIVAHVDEGHRYHQGAIRVVGSKLIDEQTVIKLLTTPQRATSWKYAVGGKPLIASSKSNPDQKTDRYDETGEDADTNSDTEPVTYWEPGEVVDFRETNETELKNGVRLALADLGFANCRFDIERLRDSANGTLDLQINVLEIVPRTVVGEIQVSGLKRDSRESLIKYLQIAPGDTLNGKTLEQINDRLADSCRYWMHRITVSISPISDDTLKAGKSEATVVLDLEEYEPAAPLSEALAPTDDVMRKCANWIKSLSADFGDQDIVCSTEAVDLGGGVGELQIAIAADGTLVVEPQFTTTQGWRGNHTLIFGPSGVELYDWQFADKFLFKYRLQPKIELRIEAVHREHGEQQANLHLGYTCHALDADSAAEKLFSQAEVAPVAMVRMTRLPGATAEVRDGVLSLKSDEFEFRIDEATGAIRSIKCANFLSAGVVAIDVKSEKGSVAKIVEKARQRAVEFPDRYDSSNPFATTLGYALQQIERQPLVQMPPEFVRLCHFAEKILSSNVAKQQLADWIEELGWASTDKTKERFTIAQPKAIEQADLDTKFYCFGPLIADKIFPRGSWPWTVCREATFYEISGGEIDESTEKWVEAATRELSRWNKQRGDGPVSSLLLARTLREIYYDRQDSFSFIAVNGNRDLTDEAFLKDVRMLTKGDHGLAVACRALAEHCGSLSEEEQEEILQFLPDGAHTPLRQLVKRRNELPDEPPGDAIEAVLIANWHDGFKDAVEAKLRSISDKVAEKPKEDSTTR